MTGWASQVEIPLRELGRIRLPHKRIRFKGGFVRLGYNKARTALLATLEDELGGLLGSPTQVEACARAATMGKAVAFNLGRFNKFEPGEHPGRHDQVRVVVA